MTALQDIRVLYHQTEFGFDLGIALPDTPIDPRFSELSHDEGVNEEIGWGALLAFNTAAECYSFIRGVMLFGDENRVTCVSAMDTDGTAIILITDRNGEGGIAFYEDNREDAQPELENEQRTSSGFEP